MTKKTRKPSLLAPQLRDPTLKKALEGFSEQLLRWRGDTGPIRDRVITVGDLTDAGLAKVRQAARGIDDIAIDPPDETEKRVDQLSNLSASGVFEIVILTWDGTNQRDYAFTEIWRATKDDLGAAVKRGDAVTGVFRDQADRGQTYYYWVRAVSTSGQPGPFNATSGTQARTSESPDAVRDAISSTVWKADTTYQPFNVIRPTSQEFELDGVPVSFQAIDGGTSGSSEPDWQASVSALGDTVSDGSVTWEAIDAGQAPLLIGTRNGNPVVVMPAVVIEEASIQTAKIKDAAIATAKIADAAIVSAKIGDAEITRAKVNSAAIGTAEIGDAAITTAKIGDAEITFAKIGDAEVDTLKLAGQAVTIPVSAFSSTGKQFSLSWTSVQSASISSSGAPISIVCSGSVRFISGFGTEYELRVVRDGTVVFYIANLEIPTTEGTRIPVAFALEDTAGSGSATYSFEARTLDDGGEDPVMEMSERSVNLLETKR